MSSPSPEDSTESRALSQTQPQSTSTSGSGAVQATEQQLKARAEGVSIEDYLLPRSLTLRLAKSVLPPNTSVQKDAVLALQKAATVFVSYLSSHANESTLKRTVTPADVLNALSELEFESFKPRLEKELDKYTDLKAAKRKPRKSTEGGDQNGDGIAKAGSDKGADGDAVVKSAEENANVTEVVVRGAKRVKKGDSGGTGGVGREDEDENEDDEMDEGEGEEHDVDADATEEEEEEDDEDEEDEAGEVGDDDIDRVEDLDRDTRSRRLVDPDAGDDTESDDDNGPGSQLRGGLGMG
ncbi:histone-fold-containing protein [Aspergillus heterothallicus]